MNDENESVSQVGDTVTGADPFDLGGDVRTSSGSPSIDEMARTLSTFGTRLDALVTSTTSYRSAITDRLVEYADMVSRLVKNQSADFAEHRSSNQQLLAELQTGIASSESTIASLAGRVDDLLRSSSGDTSHEVLTEVRSILDTQERLGQFLTDALDQFGDRVVERLDQLASDDAEPVAAALRSVRDADAAIEESLRAIGADITSLRDSLVELASGDVVGALWDEVRALRALVDDLGQDRRGAVDVPPATAAALDEVGRDLAGLRDDLSAGLVVEADDSLSRHLEEIRLRVEEIADATTASPAPAVADARLDALAASVDVTSSSMDELLSATEEIRAALGRTPTSSEGQRVDVDEVLDELRRARSDVAAIADRLDRGLELEVDVDVVDSVAALRDEVVTELDAIRRVLDARPPVAAADVGADTAAVEEALAGLPEAVAAELKSELVALRRRIKVRAEADVLTDEQLDRIAEAVAERLA